MFRLGWDQFELYEESSSLIADVRKNIEQKLLPEKKRNELKNLLDTIPNDDILHYLGSLDHIFTYLRHCKRKVVPTYTIKTFIDQHIHSKVGLSIKLLQDSIFSSIELLNVIDYYQLLEEIAFEKILRNHIEQNKHGPLLVAAYEETDLVHQFIEMTLASGEIASCLKNFDSWIDMLKRLLLRVSMNINLRLDIPLQQYASRCDFWTADVTVTDIGSFKINDHILIKHAFIILKGLEEKDSNQKIEKQSNESDQRVNTERLLTPLPFWFCNQNANKKQREVIDNNMKSNKKLRV